MKKLMLLLSLMLTLSVCGKDNDTVVVIKPVCVKVTDRIHTGDYPGQGYHQCEIPGDDYQALEFITDGRFIYKHFIDLLFVEACEVLELFDPKTGEKVGEVFNIYVVNDYTVHIEWDFTYEGVRRTGNWDCPFFS